MTIKSLNFSLLVASLESEELDLLSEELNKKTEIAPNFFKNVPLIIKIECCELNINFLQLKARVEECSFLLIGITGDLSKEQKETAQNQGIAVLKCSRHQQAKTITIDCKEKVKTEKEDVLLVTSEIKVGETEIKAKVHEGRVRSGQQVYAKESDLVINGNVSAGAEVIADGNIHIYGTLNGKVIAGAMGDINAQVFCHSFSPELISIAGVYKLSDELPSAFAGKSCIVSLKDEELSFTRFCQI
jgi:septum site-determining protein MinC